jgi:hypothetical protein
MISGSTLIGLDYRKKWTKKSIPRNWRLLERTKSKLTMYFVIGWCGSSRQLSTLRMLQESPSGAIAFRQVAALTLRTCILQWHPSGAIAFRQVAASTLRTCILQWHPSGASTLQSGGIYIIQRHPSGAIALLSGGSIYATYILQWHLSGAMAIPSGSRQHLRYVGYITVTSIRSNRALPSYAAAFTLRTCIPGPTPAGPVRWR